MASQYSNRTFMGYRRENGRAVRKNHVIILPVDDISMLHVKQLEII